MQSTSGKSSLKGNRDPYILFVLAIYPHYLNFVNNPCDTTLFHATNKPEKLFLTIKAADRSMAWGSLFVKETVNSNTVFKFSKTYHFVKLLQ